MRPKTSSLPNPPTVIEDGFTALTKLGNEFQIRHHEVARHPVESTMIGFLYVRCLALVEGAIRAKVQNGL